MTAKKTAAPWSSPLPWAVERHSKSDDGETGIISGTIRGHQEIGIIYSGIDAALVQAQEAS